MQSHSDIQTRVGVGVLLYIPVRFNLLALKLRPWCGHPVMYRDYTRFGARFHNIFFAAKHFVT